MADSNKEIVITVGSWKQIPIDSSLNELEKELRKELNTENHLKEKRPPSRKAIRKALAAVDNSKNPEIDTNSLYYKIIESRRKEIDEFGNNDTHPVALFWEIKDLTKAIAKAKFLNPSAQENQLAELAINILVDTLIGEDPSVLAESHLAIQLLREEYVRNTLIQQYHKEVDWRINRIRQHIEYPSWKIASRAMEIAIPALDALYLELQQNTDTEAFTKASLDNQSTQGNTTPTDKGKPHLQMLHTLYTNLLEARPKIEGYDEESYSLGEMRFALPNPHTVIEELEQHFQKKWKCLSPEDKKAFEEAYERYLILATKSDINDKTVMEDISFFLSAQTKLATYLKSTEKWDIIGPQIWDDLCKYAIDMFNDIQRGDIVPYRYTEYQARTAGSAFISALTKTAHDHIRAAIHESYRLLLANSYFKRFNLAFAGDLSLLVFGCSKEIEQLEEKAQHELNELQKKYSSLPIVTMARKDKISAFVRQYNEEIVDALHSPHISVKEIGQLLEILEGKFSWAARFSASCRLLELNCKMIVVYEIKEAIKEIHAFYPLMLPPDYTTASE